MPWPCRCPQTRGQQPVQFCLRTQIGVAQCPPSYRWGSMSFYSMSSYKHIIHVTFYMCSLWGPHRTSTRSFFALLSSRQSLKDPLLLTCRAGLAPREKLLDHRIEWMTWNHNAKQVIWADSIHSHSHVNWTKDFWLTQMQRSTCCLQLSTVMRDFVLESLMLRFEIHQMIRFTPTLDNKHVLANPSVVSLDATI